MRKEELEQFSQLLATGSILAVVLATVGALGFDLWLASTQWLLTGAVLIGLAIYFKK